jgi:hypothetical protein
LKRKKHPTKPYITVLVLTIIIGVFILMNNTQTLSIINGIEKDSIAPVITVTNTGAVTLETLSFTGTPQIFSDSITQCMFSNVLPDQTVTCNGKDIIVASLFSGQNKFTVDITGTYTSGEAVKTATRQASVTVNVQHDQESCTIVNCVDFGTAKGTIKMSYGSNEDDNWMDFANHNYIQQLHRDVNTRYVRVWFSNQWYRDSTFPLKQDDTYTWTNTDKYINAVLAIDATPFIVFAHGTNCYDNCQGHGVSPPPSNDDFADYVAVVVSRYKDMCDGGQLAKPCDVDEWYFEIWNEPFGDEWWEGATPRYVTMFNKVNQRIKTLTNAKVGGPSSAYFPSYWNKPRMKAFVSQTNPDFVSVHHYGSTSKANTDLSRMNAIPELLFDGPKELRTLIETHHPGKGIEIINSEYSSDFTGEYMPRLDEPFTSAWETSALITMIKSQEMDIEFFYQGTSLGSDGGFGLWGKE